MSTNSQFVTDDHATQVNQALASIAVLRNELDLYTRSGLNPDRAAALKAQIDQRETQLRQFRQVYFPNG